jgi:hypothetical protein
MTTGSSWNGQWQASGPARIGSALIRLPVGHTFPQRRHCTLQPLPERRSVYFHAHRHYPCPGLAGRALYAPKVRHLGARFRWSSTWTATDSGAVSAGSNPAGGTTRWPANMASYLGRCSLASIMYCAANCRQTPVFAVGCGPGMDQDSHGLPSPSAPSMGSRAPTWMAPRGRIAARRLRRLWAEPVRRAAV